MKKSIVTLKVIMALGVFCLHGEAYAQQDVGGLFASGPADATKLVQAYLNPLFKGFGTGLNSGWTNTAKSKGLLKFDIRITATGAFVPESDRTYDVNQLGLTNIRPVNPNISTGPTAFGADKEGAQMEIYNNSVPGTTQKFYLPQGTGFHITPSAQIQATLGLPKNIDLTLRYVPEVKLGSDLGRLQMFGIGAKVEILPLILGTKAKLVPVDVAVAGGFTQFKYNLPLNTNNQSNSDQHLDAKFNGVNIDAIVSKKLLFFTPFISVGYQTASTDLKALGTYEFNVPVTPTTPTGKQTFKDPVSIKQTDLDGLKASLGFQLKLAFFRIYGSYTAGKYNAVNAGIGLGIGK